MEVVICPHCNTTVLPMDDGRCPHCRRGLDEPVRHEVRSDMASQRQTKTARTKRIALVGIAIALVLGALLSIAVLKVRKKGLEIKNRRAEAFDLFNRFDEAHSLKDWACVVELGEELRRDRFAGQGLGARGAIDWVLAEGYFHTQRYEDAVDLQRRAIEYEGLRPDAKMLAWSYRKLARYLSFAYAESRNSEYAVEIERAIGKVYSYEPRELRRPVDQYRAFGAIKYRLDTGELSSDEAWDAKFFNDSTPGRFFRYLAIWVEAIRTGDSDFALWYHELSQPWDEKLMDGKRGGRIEDLKDMFEPPKKEDYLRLKFPEIYK